MLERHKKFQQCPVSSGKSIAASTSICGVAMNMPNVPITLFLEDLGTSTIPSINANGLNPNPVRRVAYPRRLAIPIASLGIAPESAMLLEVQKRNKA